ncbi:MAG: type IV pilus assembly protein PilM [Candidatus Pacebacteria bacterium]|nr:type IV pilus assembly protein PilM [Candidatus Paceibacterota bacterium]PIR60341.1 MAG: hypothetical protein COU67_02610 [Candidatus Pacebacteria bacterium CG10_big_fil_rev_8_21_14_0_10_44_54]
MPAALAIDIGTYSVKAIAGEPGDVVHVQRVAEVFNTTGLAVPTDDASASKLAQIVDALFSDYSLPRDSVHLSLPETVVSSKVISIPRLNDSELASAIGWQAEQHIPIPPEELSLEYQVLYRPKKNEQALMRVLLVGVRKQVVEQYISIFTQIGIEPVRVETQMLSVLRSLHFTPEDPTTLVVHLGASSMNLLMMHGGELQFVLSQLNGGQLLTKTLEQRVGLDVTQAEQYKRTYGLRPDQFEGKVSQALLPALQVLFAEVKKAIQYFVSQHPQATVERIVLSGGSALLPDLVQYVATETGTEVLIAAPFANASGEIPEKINQPGMIVCMGLLSQMK